MIERCRAQIDPNVVACEPCRAWWLAARLEHAKSRRRGSTDGACLDDERLPRDAVTFGVPAGVGPEVAEGDTHGLVVAPRKPEVVDGPDVWALGKRTVEVVAKQLILLSH